MFLLCRDCGYSTRCPDCEVALTYHQRLARLVCHHCNYERPAPDSCPKCLGNRLRPFGIGTEKIETEKPATTSISVMTSSRKKVPVPQ